MLISISWLCPFTKASWDKKEPGDEHAAHWDENIHVQNSIGILSLLANPGLTWS